MSVVVQPGSGSGTGGGGGSGKYKTIQFWQIFKIDFTQLVFLALSFPFVCV